MRVRVPMGAVSLFLAVALICSCGGRKGAVAPHSTNQIRQDLSAGQFQKALHRCQEEYQKDSKNPGILNQYLETIEYIKSFADKAFQKEDFALAGANYALLLKSFPQFAPFASQLSFERNYLTARIRASQTHMVERPAPSHLKLGNIQKAIDLYQALLHQSPRDSVVQRDYISLLETIKVHADLTFEKNDPLLAGCTYRMLWRNYAALHSISPSLSYTRDLLNIHMKRCQKKLFEDGLEQYRSGNLNMAISIWKSILTFDPENPEVKRALNTAIQQSRNLERDAKSEAK